jgi:hypothetical protein
VIVNDLDIVGIAASPDKANPSSIIDADAVLTFSVAFQRFQAIPWRNQQVSPGSGAVEIQQFPTRDSLEGAETRHFNVREHRFRLLRSKGANHRKLVYYALRNRSRKSPATDIET